MSYILEALKKAQAERQLGSTPGIHDMPAPAAVAATAPHNARLWLAVGAALLLAGAGFAFVRMLPTQEAPAQPAVAVAAPAPAAVLAPVQSTPAPLQVPAAVAQAPTPAALPVAALKPPVEVAPAAPPQPVAQPAAAPEPQADDALPLLASLPASLAAGIPRVTLGGYIYSPVPSERLLLVDKDLRREGEEVAPGLVLEKLTPGAAVMNYRGTRFRMQY